MSAHKDNHHKNFGPLNLSEWLLPKLIKSMEISLKNLGRNLHLGALKDIRKTEYYFFKDLEHIVFIAFSVVKTMCFLVTISNSYSECG